MTCAVPNFVTATAVIHPATVGVTNVASGLDNIDLFPNPNSGSFSIQGDMRNTDITGVTFQVYNLLGQLILADNATVQNTKLNKSFEINSIPDGVYLMNITGDEGQSKIIRFTVQH